MYFQTGEVFTDGKWCSMQMHSISAVYIYSLGLILQSDIEAGPRTLNVGSDITRKMFRRIAVKARTGNGVIMNSRDEVRPEADDRTNKFNHKEASSWFLWNAFAELKKQTHNHFIIVFCPFATRYSFGGYP